MDAISPFALAGKLDPSRVPGALQQISAIPGAKGLKPAVEATTGFAETLQGAQATGRPSEPRAGLAPPGPAAALGMLGFALSRVVEMQAFLASAPPAPPSPPASQAPENLPRPEDIRATYGVFAPVH